MLREPNFLTITERTNLLEIKTHLLYILESKIALYFGVQIFIRNEVDYISALMRAIIITSCISLLHFLPKDIHSYGLHSS